MGTGRYHFLILLLVAILFSISIPNVFAAGAISEGFAIGEAFGILLMISGFAYVLLVAPQQDSGILHVIIGSTVSGGGFMLARKMVKVRNLVLGKKEKLQMKS